MGYNWGRSSVPYIYEIYPPVITLPIYERIFKIVHSLHSTVQGYDGKPNCLFYNFAAAYILLHKLKVHAVPVCGAAAVKVLPNPVPTLAMGQIDDASGDFYSDGEGFHCWVMTAGHYLDFTAPLYGDYITAGGLAAPKVARMMFQKPKSAMANSLENVTRPGDFFFQGDMEMTQAYVAKIEVHAGVIDLVQACGEWFVKRTEPHRSTVTILDNQGAIIDVRLDEKSIVGVW